MVRQQAVLQLAQQQVVAEVGEERQVVQRVVDDRQQVGVVRLQQGLGVGAEADERRAHALQLRGQALHVHRAARDAGRHEVGEERVHLRRRAQRRQLRDGGGQAGDLVHQRRLGLLIRRRLLLDDDSYFFLDLLLQLLLLLLLLLAHDDHGRVQCDHSHSRSRSRRLLLRFGVGEAYYSVYILVAGIMASLSRSLPCDRGRPVPTTSLGVFFSTHATATVTSLSQSRQHAYNT